MSEGTPAGGGGGSTKGIMNHAPWFWYESYLGPVCFVLLGFFFKYYADMIHI